MSLNNSPWDEAIIESMRPGAVTFAWDDGEIRTVAAPEKALETMETAWQWIDAKLKEFEHGPGRPRRLCFRLANGQFRGLRFPDWNPGEL